MHDSWFAYLCLLFKLYIRDIFVGNFFLLFCLLGSYNIYQWKIRMILCFVHMIISCFLHMRNRTLPIWFVRNTERLFFLFFFWEEEILKDWIVFFEINYMKMYIFLKVNLYCKANSRGYIRISLPSRLVKHISLYKWI